jgi:hypothetical protein
MVWLGVKGLVAITSWLEGGGFVALLPNLTVLTGLISLGGVEVLQAAVPMTIVKKTIYKRPRILS